MEKQKLHFFIVFKIKRCVLACKNIRSEALLAMVKCVYTQATGVQCKIAVVANARSFGGIEDRSVKEIKIGIYLLSYECAVKFVIKPGLERDSDVIVNSVRKLCAEWCHGKFARKNICFGLGRRHGIGNVARLINIWVINVHHVS